jgi:glutamyl/glutaminyl-tRNA synthetase
MSRKYSVEEIDAMRKSIEWSYPSGVSYYAHERSAEIENRLRTYMQNGTTPAELKEMEDRALQREMQAQEQMRGVRARMTSDSDRHPEGENAEGG